MEPAPRIELGPPPYHGGVLPLSPSRHGWPGWNRTSVPMIQSHGAHASRAPAIGSPSPESDGAGSRYKGPLRPARRARCARRESNPHHPASHAGLSASWSTSTWSRHRVPTPAACLTGAGSQAVCDGVAARQGFEPQFTAPEAAVLPVRRSGIGCGRRHASRTRKPRDLSSRGLPVAITPA
jgi:hypothetical protein